MIKVKHPLEHCNRTQETTILQLPDEQRRFHELLYCYGNATYRYHQLAKQHEPTEEDYIEWLEGLPENISRDMAAKGFEDCRTILSFTRYVNEKHDVGMDEYVRELMGQEEYSKYRTLFEARAINPYQKEEDSDSEFVSTNSDDSKYKTQGSILGSILEEEDLYMIFGAQEGQRIWLAWMESNLNLSEFAAQNLTDEQREAIERYWKEEY